MDSGLADLVSAASRAIQAVRQWRWLALGVAAVVAMLCATGTEFVPERYEASSSVYVDTQTVLKPMMIGLAYKPDVEQQVRMLAKTLISRPNVDRLIDQPELGFTFTGPLDREATVSRLMERIKVVGAGGSNYYLITYRDSDPLRARKLV